MAANYLSQPERGVVSIKEEQFTQKPPGLTIEIGAITTKDDQLETCGSCGTDWTRKSARLPVASSTNSEFNDSDWSLSSSSQWKARMSSDGGRGYEKLHGSEEAILIQNLTDESFTKVCIDSGAGESVYRWTPSPVMRRRSRQRLG